MSPEHDVTQITKRLTEMADVFSQHEALTLQVYVLASIEKLLRDSATALSEAFEAGAAQERERLKAIVPQDWSLPLILRVDGDVTGDNRHRVVLEGRISQRTSSVLVRMVNAVSERTPPTPET